MNGHIEQAKPYRRVIRWYDPRARTWVVQVKDSDGNQIGEADFCYTEKEAKGIQKTYRSAFVACPGGCTLEKETR